MPVQPHCQARAQPRERSPTAHAISAVIMLDIDNRSMFKSNQLQEAGTIAIQLGLLPGSSSAPPAAARGQLHSNKISSQLQRCAEPANVQTVNHRPCLQPSPPQHDQRKQVQRDRSLPHMTHPNIDPRLQRQPSLSNLYHCVRAQSYRKSMRK